MRRRLADEPGVVLYRPEGHQAPAALWVPAELAEQIRAEYVRPLGPQSGPIAPSPDRPDVGPDAGPDIRPDADGWQAALEEARARTADAQAAQRRAEAEADRLRSELAVAQAEARAARLAAEETAEGRHAARQELAALRLAWERWHNALGGRLAAQRWWRPATILHQPPAMPDEQGADAPRLAPPGQGATNTQQKFPDSP